MKQQTIGGSGQGPWEKEAAMALNLTAYRKGDPQKPSSLPELTRPGFQTWKPMQTQFTEQNT